MCDPYARRICLGDISNVYKPDPEGKRKWVFTVDNSDIYLRALACKTPDGDFDYIWLEASVGFVENCIMTIVTILNVADFDRFFDYLKEVRKLPIGGRLEIQIGPSHLVATLTESDYALLSVTHEGYDLEKTYLDGSDFNAYEEIRSKLSGFFAF
jgi:hypothetical protein